MPDLHSLVVERLETWTFIDEPRDWDDVLRRAGSPRRRHRRALVLGFALFAALAVAPAFGLVSRLVKDDPTPHVTLSATFGGAVSGRVTFSAPGVFVAIARRGRIVVPRWFYRTPRGVRHGRPHLRWTLRVGGDAGAVRSARLLRGPGARHGRVLATLCAPCAPGASGVVRPSRITYIALFNNRTLVELRSEAGTARAPVVLVRRR